MDPMGIDTPQTTVKVTKVSVHTRIYRDQQINQMWISHTFMVNVHLCDVYTTASVIAWIPTEVVTCSTDSLGRRDGRARTTPERHRSAVCFFLHKHWLPGLEVYGIYMIAMYMWINIRYEYMRICVFIGESSIANSERSTFISVVSTLMLVWYSFHGVKWHMGCLKMVPLCNHRFGDVLLLQSSTGWAPTSCKWSYNL